MKHRRRETCGPRSYHDSPVKLALSNKYTPSEVGAFMHVLALELPQLSM